MIQSEPIRVFIGSGEASLLERKVCIHSLRKHTQRPIDIYVFNGTHNAIELNDQEPVIAPMSLKVKYKNVTEFSLYRYLIPQVCGYQGKAIYIDSDTICLRDIGELIDTDLQGCDFLAKPEAYSHAGEALWGLSVMLIDCEKCQFDLELYFEEIAQGLYTYEDFSCMSPRFLKHHPFSIEELDPRWNVFDSYDQDTRLIHYTNLSTQPWKHPNHSYGELWFQYFRDAIADGTVLQTDIDLSLIRSYVRQDLMAGNSPPQANVLKQATSALKSVRKLWKPQLV
ncbi:glycosyltransferase [Leptolyngbya sp. AN03gr2]|uniref:glycosyltransferase n=1 Tax=unclassified Leptolyngbya TaxID=2650499 RepID=UPI003D3128C7